MVTSYLANLTLDIIEKVGSKAAGTLIEKLRDWPTSSSEAETYFHSIKQAALSDLKDTEQIMQRSLSLLMSKNEMEIHDTIARLRKRLEQLRDDINKSGSDTYLSAVENEDILRALSMIYVTMQYELYIISHEANEMYDKLEFGGDFKSHYRDLTKAIRNLEQTWRLRSKATADPNTAEALFRELKQSRGKWVELIEGFNEKSLGEMNEIFTGVVINKPKLFGKSRYQDSLADLTWNYARKNNITKIELPELSTRISSDNPDAEFEIDDLEAAIEQLIENNKAFSLGVENNIKYVEFATSDETRVCGRCGKKGGIYEDFRECTYADNLVCDDCITFFKKCRLCETKISKGHPLLK